jgi:flagellar biogenesis protein FliO
MDGDMRESIMMTKSTERELLLGQTADNIMANGEMENKMDSECIST